MGIAAVTHSAKRSRQGPASVRGALRTAFCRTSERGFTGYALNPDEPSRKFSVEILIDGLPFRVIRADASVPELSQEGIGDGCYGFSCAIPNAVAYDIAVVEARLANLGTPVGTPIALLAWHPLSHPSTSRSIRWLGGLRFSGWIAVHDESTAANVHVDGKMIARVRATAWTHFGTSEEDARAVRAFDFYLPERFADGNVHQLTMNDDVGENISGNPLVFVAYPDGLRAALAGQGISREERLRAELFDQLLPMSVPFTNYQAWRDRFPNLCGPPVVLRGAVILVGPGAMDDTLESLQDQTHTHWIAASLPQTSEPTGLHTELAKDFLNKDGADCDFVVFALAGTLFAPSALQRIACALADFPIAQAVYADLEIQSDDGLIWPLAFSAFDYERALEQGYCSYLFALRRDAAKRALDNDAASLYQLFNSVLDSASTSECNVVHVPGPLGTLPEFDKAAASAALAAASLEHLKHKGIAAQAILEPAGILPNVHIKRSFERPHSAIIVPTRNRKDMLQGCIDSIRPAIERTRAELVIVDNDSTDPETLSYLAKLEKRDATVLRVHGDFNFSRLNNHAVKTVNADILCLLNNDVKAFDDSWLEEMLGRASDVDVGAVGALLVWPSQIVQHGGVILGPNFAATHAFNDRIDNDFGYGDLLRVAHECSAVTAACMVTRRLDYLQVGGMDEVRFPINFNDVDYCLKLRAIGKRIVFTPHAKLLHLESASRGLDIRSNKKARLERELQNLRTKWGNVLASDPYYSPMLSLDPIPFSGLAWPNRSMQPRLNNSPIPVHVPFGF